MSSLLLNYEVLKLSAKTSAPYKMEASFWEIRIPHSCLSLLTKRLRFYRFSIRPRRYVQIYFYFLLSCSTWCSSSFFTMSLHAFRFLLAFTRRVDKFQQIPWRKARCHHTACTTLSCPQLQRCHVSVSEKPVDQPIHTVSLPNIGFGGIDDRIGIVMDLHLLLWRLLLPTRRVIRSRQRASTVRLGTWSHTQSTRRILPIIALRLHSLKPKIFVLWSETAVTSMSTPVYGSEMKSIADLAAIVIRVNQLVRVLFRFGPITSKTSNISTTQAHITKDLLSSLVRVSRSGMRTRPCMQKV